MGVANRDSSARNPGWFVKSNYPCLTGHFLATGCFRATLQSARRAASSSSLRPPPPPTVPPTVPATLSATVHWPDPARLAHFERWLQRITAEHALQPQTLAPASADASFRRYLRLQGGGASYIVMDAPPPLEDVRPFVHVAALLQQADLPAPRVLQADVEHGFLLLTDLGDSLYLDALLAAQAGDDTATAHTLMMQALQALVQFQRRVPASELPPFSAQLLQTELDLFPEWCVGREFGIRWGDKEQAVWQRTCQLLVDNALQQPQTAVHADWMPRNLMLPAPNSGEAAGGNRGAAGGNRRAADASGLPGLLDFQDAVSGPITYDTASLLRDAFISWSEEQELDWAVRGWELQRKAGLPVHADFGQHWRELEWMGLQRHLKVLGIFCRLKHRDGKPRYAQDLPRFLGYATRVALRYGPLKPLLRLLEPLSGAQVKQGFTF